MSRAVVLVCLVGCAYQHGTTGEVTGDAGGSADARSGDGSGTPDARVFLDAPIHGSIIVTSNTLPDGDVSLSTLGTADWAHWAMTTATTFDHAAGVDLISDITLANSMTQTQITNITTTASWTGGTPDATANATGTATATVSPGALQFTAAAGIAPHTLTLYLGGRNSHGQLDVSLSDSSATAYSDNSFSSGGAYHSVYAIVYNAASDGQTLNVSWTDLQDGTGSAWVMIMSATLQ